RVPAIAVAHSKQRRLPHDLNGRYLGRCQAVNRFGDNEAQVVRHAIVKTAPPMAAGVGFFEVRLDPDLAVTYLDRTGRNIVGPQIERASTRQIETGVVPVAGQDAVVDCAFLQREAHMRATVVEGENPAAIEYNENRAVTATDNSPTRTLERIERPG